MASAAKPNVARAAVLPVHEASRRAPAGDMHSALNGDPLIQGPASPPG